MIISVSTTLFLSWFRHIIRIFDVWIVFGLCLGRWSCLRFALLFSFPDCGLLLDPAVCQIAITILGIRTKRKTVTVLDFCDLRLALAVWWLAVSCLRFAPAVYVSAVCSQCLSLPAGCSLRLPYLILRLPIDCEHLMFAVCSYFCVPLHFLHLSGQCSYCDWLWSLKFCQW